MSLEARNPANDRRGIRVFKNRSGFRKFEFPDGSKITIQEDTESAQVDAQATKSRAREHPSSRDADVANRRSPLRPDPRSLTISHQM